MICKYCGKSKTIKKGKRNDRQRYYCKNCKRSFQDEYSYTAYNSSTNTFIVKLLKECCGIRSISRILNISCTTILSRMLKLGKEIQPPLLTKRKCNFELDEIFVKIANGKTQNYIAYALERESKKIIGFVIGGRSKNTIRPLTNKILLLHPNRIYTDGLAIYNSLIPTEIHRKVRYGTNRIERMNLTIRTHIKRLARRTICFTRNEKYLEAHLKIYFWAE